MHQIIPPPLFPPETRFSPSHRALVSLVVQGKKKPQNMKNFLKTHLLSAQKVEKVLDYKARFDETKSVKWRLITEYFFDFLGR